MKAIFIPLALSLQFVVSGVQAQDFDKEKAVSEVKGITKEFARTLKGELVAAMKAGGPLNALGVCNVEAMPITSNIASEKNARVSRVSLKNRNPENVPNDWQAAILKDFDTRAADGEDVETMGAVSIVDHEGKKRVRFMKAMPTGGECLACHGEQLSGDVQAKLDELYPTDKATGYSLGQIRGAIVVIKDY